jgi:TonB family protein
MTRRDVSLMLALCASLAMHVLLLGSAAEWYSQQLGNIRLPGFAKSHDTLGLMVVPTAQPRADEEEDPMQRLGDSAGKGTAIGESPGDLPMQARQSAQEQPFLSLDPAGPGKIGDDPTDSMIPLGHAGAPAPAAPPAMPAPAPPRPVAQNPPVQLAAITPPPQAAQPEVPFGFGAPASQIPTPFAAPAEPPKAVTDQAADAKPEPTKPLAEEEPKPAEALAIAAAPSTPQAQPAPSGVDRQLPAQPGADKAADPAPLGSTESDPTSTRGFAEFRAGSTSVRLGRKFKLTRPRLSLASINDLMAVASPTVVLKLTIDESGNVISADVYRSSGSTNVDQPCQLAAYNWWFEPTKDKSGKPIKDVILFTIRFF